MSRPVATVVLALVLCVLLAPWTGAYAGGQAVHGTLRAPDGAPVAGVTITATQKTPECTFSNYQAVAATAASHG